MKKVIRLTENDLYRIVRNSVNKLLKEDSIDHYFGWMDDKDYSQYDDEERRELEQDLDFRDSLSSYQKDKEIESDWNDIDSGKYSTNVPSQYNNYENMSQGNNSFARIGVSYDDEPFEDGYLSMLAQQNDLEGGYLGKDKSWASIQENKKNITKIIRKNIRTKYEK